MNSPDGLAAHLDADEDRVPDAVALPDVHVLPVFALHHDFVAVLHA